MNESLTLPRVEVASDDESMDDQKFSPNEFYQEWISCQNKYTIKILSDRGVGIGGGHRGQGPLVFRRRLAI